MHKISKQVSRLHVSCEVAQMNSPTSLLSFEAEVENAQLLVTARIHGLKAGTLPRESLPLPGRHCQIYLLILWQGYNHQILKWPSLFCGCFVVVVSALYKALMEPL